MTREAPLRDLLRRYSLAYRPSAAPIPIGNAGGLSGARLWRISAPRGEFLLRLWPETETDAERLRRRLAWVLRLEDLSYVPRPVPALDGQVLQTALGRLWHLESWRPGVPDQERPPSESHIRAGIRGLALVHRQWEREASFGTSPGLQTRWREVSSLCGGEFSTLREAVARSPLTPEKMVALAWLSEAPRLLSSVHRQLAASRETNVALQPTLRDVRSDHLLFMWR